MRGARTIAPLLLAVAPFGLLFGALATRLGFSPLAALAISLLLFAGASQFVFVQLAAAGVPLGVVVAACAVVNLRHLLYSVSLAPRLEGLRQASRALASYLLTDEAYAVTIRAAAGEAAPSWFFIGAGVTLWGCWQLSTLVGAVIGTSLPPSPLYAFTLPLTFVAIVAPQLRDRAAIATAVVAGVVGVAGSPLPLGTGLIVASMAAIAVGSIVERKKAS